MSAYDVSNLAVGQKMKNYIFVLLGSVFVFDSGGKGH